MDLRRLVFVDRVGVRRLAALVYGLPPDAAVWRRDTFTPVEELLATLVERADAWHQAIMQAVLGHGEIQSPGVVQIPRPTAKVHEMPQRKVETDIKKIAAWFGSAA